MSANTAQFVETPGIPDVSISSRVPSSKSAQVSGDSAGCTVASLVMGTHVGQPPMNATAPLTTTLSPLLPHLQQAAASAGIPFGYTPLAPDPFGQCKTCVPGTPEHELLSLIPEMVRESWHNLLHYARVEEHRRNFAENALPYVKAVKDWAVDGRTLYTSFNKAAQFLHHRGLKKEKPTKTDVERFLKARNGRVLTHDVEKNPLARPFEALKSRSLPQIRHAIRKFVDITGYSADGSGLLHPLTPMMENLLAPLPAGIGRQPAMMKRAAQTVPNPENQNFIATCFGPIIPPFVIQPNPAKMSAIQQEFSILCNFTMFLGARNAKDLQAAWWNAYWHRRAQGDINLAFDSTLMAVPLEQMKPSSIDHRKTILKRLMAPNLGGRASLLDRVGKSAFRRANFDIGQSITRAEFHAAYQDAPGNQAMVELAIAYSTLSPTEKRQARLSHLTFFGPYQVAVIEVPERPGTHARRVFIFHGREALLDFANKYRDDDPERYIIGDGDNPIDEAEFNKRIEDLLRPSLDAGERKTHAMAMKQAACIDLLAQGVNEDIVRILQGHVKPDETLRLAEALAHEENDTAFDAFTSTHEAAPAPSTRKCRGCGKRLPEKAKACACGRATSAEPIDPKQQMANAALRRVRTYLDYEEKNTTELGQDALSILRRAGGAKNFLGGVGA